LLLYVERVNFILLFFLLKNTSEAFITDCIMRVKEKKEGGMFPPTGGWVLFRFKGLKFQLR